MKTKYTKKDKSKIQGRFDQKCEEWSNCTLEDLNALYELNKGLTVKQSGMSFTDRKALIYSIRIKESVQNKIEKAVEEIKQEEELNNLENGKIL